MLGPLELLVLGVVIVGVVFLISLVLRRTRH